MILNPTSVKGLINFAMIVLFSYKESEFPSYDQAYPLFPASCFCHTIYPPERIVNGTKSRIDHATVNGSPVAGNTDLL